MPINSQFGFAYETTPGTAVTPNRFLGFVSEDINTAVGRHRVPVLRSSGISQRLDATTVWVEGASGSLKFPVPSQGFASWLRLMTGSVATTGPFESTVYRHTGTPANLTGTSATMQVNRPDQTGTNRPFTFAGCKLTEWSLSSQIDEVLQFEASVDAVSVTTATALASASYPTSLEMFSWVGTEVSIGGVAIPVRSVKVSCQTGLETGRKRLRNSATPIEQIPAELFAVTFECVADFRDLSLYDRVASSTVSGATTDVVAIWQGSVIGSTLRNQVKVTMPAVQFDEGFPAVSGPAPIELALKGVALVDTSAAMTIEVQSVETTP